MARREDSQEVAEAWDAARGAETKIDIHIAECVILRKNITQELTTIKRMILWFGGGVLITMIGTIAFLADKLVQ